MVEDALIIGGSVLGGGVLAGAITLLISQKKQQQLVDQLAKSTAGFERNQSESKRRHEEELRTATAAKQRELDGLNHLITNLNSDMAMREGVLKLMEKCQAEFAEADSSQEIWSRLMDIIRELFGEDLQMAYALGPHTPYNQLAPETPASTEDNKALDLQRKVNQPSTSMEANRLQKWKAEDVEGFAEVKPGVTNIAISAISGRSGRLGHLVLAFSGEGQGNRLNQLRQVLEMFAQVLHRVRLLEQEIISSRVDFLTKLPNLKALNEILPPLLKMCLPERPVAVLLIECDSLKVINEKYGHLVGDELIKEMGAAIRASARIEELNSEKRPVDHLIRYCGTQFVLVLEETDLTFAMTVAERIRAFVDMKTDWYGGVPRWSVSIGVANAPEDDREYQTFLIKAEIALMYVKEKLNGNQVIAFSQVPRQYRVSKLSDRVDGSLKVFDPFNMLQSVVTSGKTGIISVDERAGRRFWAFVKDNQINKAHLGILRGDWAVSEFLSTFEDGSFSFQEYSSLDKETMEEIHRMHDIYSVKKTITRHLMDGANAQEKLASARRMITNTRLYCRPTREAANIIAAFPQMSPPPSREELEAMAAITKYINGRTMLATIMDRLEMYPTWLRWHGSAFLIENGAMELSKLALTFSL